MTHTSGSPTYVNGVDYIINPQLGSLANNGGPTKTHALLAGSLAHNRGSNSLILQAIISTGLTLFTAAALAQSYSIDRFAIGGGGASTGGV